MIKIYCDHGAVTKNLQKLQHSGRVQLIHFPYDPDSRSKHLKHLARPSDAQWRDLHVNWEEADWPWEEFSGSDRFDDILSTLGPENRRDALHIDSAFKSGCEVFVTCDTDILSRREQLESLASVRIFDPINEAEKLVSYLNALSQG
jgi:hypothetical protein